MIIMYFFFKISIFIIFIFINKSPEQNKSSEERKSLPQSSDTDTIPAKGPTDSGSESSGVSPVKKAKVIKGTLIYLVFQLHAVSRI